MSAIYLQWKETASSGDWNKLLNQIDLTISHVSDNEEWFPNLITHLDDWRFLKGVVQYFGVKNEGGN